MFLAILRHVTSSGWVFAGSVVYTIIGLFMLGWLFNIVCLSVNGRRMDGSILDKEKKV